MRQIQFYFWVLLSFLLATLLISLPWSKGSVDYFPKIDYLVLIYWVTYLPRVVGVLTAWGFGLLSDILFAKTYLGETAWAMSAIAYLNLLLSHRLRVFPWWQQSTIILVLIGFSQLIALLMRAFLGTGRPADLSYWLPTLTSVLAWPFLYSLLQLYQKYCLRTGAHAVGNF
ncbi:MAG: rod shape-determining protein MreD [Gammaproteobacteria bacterium]